MRRVYGENSRICIRQHQCLQKEKMVEDLPEPVVEEKDGLKVITEYRYNEDGKKVKVSIFIRAEW
jgi:hypothetical protein